MSEHTNEQSRYLTTTQAARRLSVSPDTVLKWAKAGKIASVRTYGGHYRIPLSEVEDETVRSPGSTGVMMPTLPPAHQYCWQYLAEGGEIKPECRDCITYRSRSRRCYELRDLPEGLGCLGAFCSTTCDECDYYTLVREQETLVLILSENQRLLRDRDSLEEHPDFHVIFAQSEYECSSVIEANRPDFIVVDCSLGKKRTSTVCRNLFNDPRIPVARIILSSRKRKVDDYCDQGTFGWIAKPFSINQLRDCIEGVQRSISGRPH